MIFRLVMTGTTLMLLTLAASFGAATGATPKWFPITELENVRSYAAAARGDGRSYAVDGGRLYAGIDGVWESVSVPWGVVINAVAVDRSDEETVFIGAANRLSVFVSRDAGRHWVEVPMDSDAVGGVTSLAFDAPNRLLYVGTDRDGAFRLRDVGAGGRGGLVASGHLLLEEPVQEIVSDNTGAGLAFIRTQAKLYRAEAFGLRWITVESLPGRPTAVAVADTSPPKVFAGTAGAGLQVSWDGVVWRSAGPGLTGKGDSQLQVSDVAVDPGQPHVVYVGTAGTGDFERRPGKVLVSRDGGAHWSTVGALEDGGVAELLPVSGRAGTVYALTTASRSPQAVDGTARVEKAVPASSVDSGAGALGVLAWILAGHAIGALGLLVASGIRGRRRERGAFRMEAVQFG